MGLNGNVGNKNSGRKTDAEIVRHYIDIGLANSIGNQELKRIKVTPMKKRKREDLKEIVMPVILKGITEKSETTLILPKPILSNILDKKDENNQQGNITSETKDL